MTRVNKFDKCENINNGNKINNKTLIIITFRFLLIKVPNAILVSLWVVLSNAVWIEWLFLVAVPLFSFYVLCFPTPNNPRTISQGKRFAAKERNFVPNAKAISMQPKTSHHTSHIIVTPKKPTHKQKKKNKKRTKKNQKTGNYLASHNLNCFFVVLFVLLNVCFLFLITYFLKDTQ